MNTIDSVFARKVANMCRARFPFLYISSWEEERVLAAVKSIASDESMIKTIREVFIWRSTTGFSTKERVLEDTRNPVRALEFIEKHEGAAIFIFMDFHIFFGGSSVDPVVIRKIRDIVGNLKQGHYPQNVIFISPVLTLPNDLQKDVTVVDFDLPTFNEIHSALSELISINKSGGRITINLSDADIELLVKAAQGLTLQEAENAFARAMVERGTLDKDSVDIIMEEKCQVIKKSGILELIKTEFNISDIGGLDNLKRWLTRRSKAWHCQTSRYCLPDPKGVLITGVPGCGKSLTAKAISAIWKLPLLKLDVGRIFGSYIGSSEENMRNAIKTAEAISPCILWIDEIEKGFSGTGSSGDSGTTSRVFGTFLTWMQEKNKPVFVVATANNIDALPAEMLRKGRFDEIFFVDLPNLRERTEIFHLHMEKRLKDDYVRGSLNISQAAQFLAGRSEGFVGSEIEQVVIEGLFEAFSEDRPVRLEDFLQAVNRFVPLSVTQEEQISNIREWAAVRAVSATGSDENGRVEISNGSSGWGSGGRTIN